MKRTPLVTAAALAVGAALAPASASASVIELGKTRTPLAAPAPCTTTGSGTGKTTTCPNGHTAANYAIILTRVTALETLADAVAYPTTVKKKGWIVAYTVGLSGLDTNRAQARLDIHNLDVAWGPHPELQIAVLRRVGKKSKRKFKMIAESPPKHIQPWLGQVVQFPLQTNLPVNPGDVVALTTPTWAPVLTLDQPTSQFAYRQSRSTGCSAPPATSAAQSVGQVVQYGCDYSPAFACTPSQHGRCSTRVEYTATEVTEPVAINPIHARDIGP